MTRGQVVGTAVVALLVVGVTIGLVVAAGTWAEADRPIFFEGGLADVPPPESPVLASNADPVFTQGQRSEQFAALVAPLMTEGAELVHTQELRGAGPGGVDDAWFEMPDGAVVLVSRQYVGSDFSAPLDLVFMGRDGSVEDWGNGVEVAISTTLHFAELNVVAGEWMLSIVAQEGPVWFGEGDPPRGFSTEGRRGEVPPLDDLRAVARRILEQGTTILAEP
jgi:hypothetical protein